MAQPNLVEVFGAGASQSETQLIISKAALVELGLTPSATNTAESLKVALVKLWAKNLTELARSEDPTNRHATTTYATQDLVEQPTNQFWIRDAYTVLLYKSTSKVDVDPDNY